jgi:hypothetical protein
VDKVVALLGIAASLTAAALWLWASLVDVPANIGTIVSELQRIGRINAGAAGSRYASFGHAIWDTLLKWPHTKQFADS